jgi:hypothetical protein
MKQEEFLSLYDYLGHAAGLELGGKVHKTAVLSNEPIKIRQISNPKYKGEVNLYTRAFLDSYFKKPTIEENLPF